MGAYYIISDNKKVVSEIDFERQSVAVLVHLFYEEQIEVYCEYLSRVPNFVDIIIISSKNTILECFSNKRFRTIKKQNRGRDISALLIAAKNLIFEYEYICFIHDKKEKRQEEKDYVDSWVKNLWNNMLQSSTYIYNVLEAFQDNKIGMLVPLPPYGKDIGAWLNGAWGSNFENVKELAKKLNISGDICLERPPITYSTVFWTKPEAIKKLFSIDWKYTDFPDEPMKEDGETNHAIERILQYVVEDAGYETRIVLSTSFAAHFIDQLHSDMNSLWKQLDTSFGVSTYRGLDQYNHIKTFVKEHADIYLYGAGERGKECLKICKYLNIIPQGIIVTETKDIYGKIEGIPVVSISELTLTENTGIIISVRLEYREEIIKELEKRGFPNYIVYGLCNM